MAAAFLLEVRMDYEDRRRSSPDEKNFKRRMKTPVQLEALERVYAGVVPAILLHVALSTLTLAYLILLKLRPLHSKPLNKKVSSKECSNLTWRRDFTYATTGVISLS